MKPSRSLTIITAFLLLLSSALVLLSAGCSDFSTSSKAVDLSEASPGDTLTYSLKIINSGSDPASGTVVTDRLDADLENAANISAGGVYDPGTRTITWSLGSVPSRGQVNISFTADIVPSSPAGTSIENHATITFSGGDTTNTNTVQTTVAASPQPGIAASLGKAEDGWSGAVPVWATLENLDQADYPCARAVVTTPASAVFHVPLTWNPGAGRFEGTIYPGSNDCMGCADPHTGAFAVRVELDDDPGFGSVDYLDDTDGFSTFVTRRKSSIGTGRDYTDLNPVWSGDHWRYTISDLVIYAESAKEDVAVAIPFHPATATISNISVSCNGVAVPEGSASSTADCWWWEPDLHTLYLQRSSLGTAEVDVDLAFDSDTDLFATRYDRVNTADMANRKFYNGLMISNRYWTTFVYGGGHEHAGMQAESRAHEAGGPDVSTDCMERTAVHVDDAPASDGSGSYAYDIKWKQQEWMDYIVSEGNGSITVAVHSDDTPGSGWQQQLDTGIAATRTNTFYAGERYIAQELSFVNNGASAHTYSLVWGREQWIGTDRQANDEGRYAGDAMDRDIEATVAMSSLASPWMVAYDSGVYAAQGLIFQAGEAARYGYLLSDPALGSTSCEWVDYGSEYRPDDTGSGAYAENIFFDKVFSAVAPGETVTFTFWQWFYDTGSWDSIQGAMQEDYAELQ